VDNLIVGPLEKSRIDGYDRLEAFNRKTGSERNRMLFSYADVKEPVWETAGKGFQARPLGHGCRDCQNFGILFGKSDDRISKDLCI
jgi:hypothetical protein